MSTEYTFRRMANQALFRTPEQLDLAVIDALLISSGYPRADASPQAEELAEDAESLLSAYAGVLLARKGKVMDFDSPANGVGFALRNFEYGLQATLGSALTEVVLQGYTLGRGTHDAWVRRIELRDFKTHEIALGATAPKLDEVPAAGSPYGITELAGLSSTTALRTFGRVIQVGRRAIVANDLSDVLHSAEAYGLAASHVEADLAYAALIAITYSSGNGNLASTPGSVTAATLDAALSLFRSQRDERSTLVTGETGNYLAQEPGAVLVPVGHEVVALTVIQNAYGSDPNRPRVIADPRLTDSAWYLVANSRYRAAVTLATLQGARGPRVSLGAIPGFDGVAVRISHDVTAASVDHRSAVRTPLT